MYLNKYLDINPEVAGAVAGHLQALQPVAAIGKHIAVLDDLCGKALRRVQNGWIACLHVFQDLRRHTRPVEKRLGIGPTAVSDHVIVLFRHQDPAAELLKDVGVAAVVGMQMGQQDVGLLQIK